MPVRSSIANEGSLASRLGTAEQAQRFLSQLSNPVIFGLLGKINQCQQPDGQPNPELKQIIEFADHYHDRYTTLTEKLFDKPKQLIALLEEASSRLDKNTDAELFKQIDQLLQMKHQPNEFRSTKVLNDVRAITKRLADNPNEEIKALAKQGQSLCQQIQGGKSPNNKGLPKNFCVEMWDKSKLETLFLGDYLSCCLASDGAQFEAMVERILDSAMLFPMVIDESTNKPVAGIWLFLAKDKQNPNQIVAVSNFMEINTNYGLNDGTRNAFVKRLLKFTHDYAQAAGLKGGFILRPLEYGLIPDFEHLTPASINNNDYVVEIDKVGDFFRGNEYYLDALYCNEFHHYSDEGLAFEFPPGSTAETRVQEKSPGLQPLKTVVNKPQQQIHQTVANQTRPK